MLAGPDVRTLGIEELPTHFGIRLGELSIVLIDLMLEIGLVDQDSCHIC